MDVVSGEIKHSPNTDWEEKTEISLWKCEAPWLSYKLQPETAVERHECAVNHVHVDTVTEASTAQRGLSKPFLL